MYPEKRSRTQNLPPCGCARTTTWVGVRLRKRWGRARTSRAHPAARALGVRASRRSLRTPPRSLRFASPSPRAPSRRSPPRASDRSSAGRDRQRVLASLGRRSERPERNHGVRCRRAPAQNHQGASRRRARRARGPTHGLDPPVLRWVPFGTPVPDSYHPRPPRWANRRRIRKENDEQRNSRVRNASFSRFFPRARAHAAFCLPPFLPVRYRRSRAGDPALAFRARDRDLRAAAGG